MIPVGVNTVWYARRVGVATARDIKATTVGLLTTLITLWPSVVLDLPQC